MSIALPIVTTLVAALLALPAAQGAEKPRPQSAPASAPSAGGSSTPSTQAAPQPPTKAAPLNKGVPPADAGLVDINNASLEALMSLQGINRERALAIVKNRPYSSPAQLVTDRILSASVFTKLKPRLVALKPEGG